MNTHPAALVTRDVRHRFDRAASRFDDSDFVHRTAFDGLLERLSPMTLEPQRILDLGCATGSGSRPLVRRFRGGRVIGVDASLPMLQCAARKKGIFGRRPVVQGDATRLPLKDGSIDLVFANMLLPWIDDLPACLAEIARVTRRDGLFAFATLGPESLSELRSAWRSVDRDCHVNAFPDMHDVGDALIQAGMRDPVLDVDYLTVTYREARDLYRDLTSAGARNCLHGRKKTLTGKSRFRAMDRSLESATRDGLLSFRLELVYGHAWGGGPRLPEGEFRLDPAQISRRHHD